MSEIEIRRPKLDGTLPTYIIEHSSVTCLGKLTEDNLWEIAKEFGGKREESPYIPNFYTYEILSEGRGYIYVGLNTNPKELIEEDLPEHAALYREHFGAIPETCVSINLGSTKPDNYESMELAIEFAKAFQN